METISRPTIIIIDDEPLMSDLYTHKINKSIENINILSAKSKQELTPLFESPDICLFIVDVNLKNESGFDVAKAIRQIPHLELTPIIFFTSGLKASQTVEMGYQSGAVDIIDKSQSDYILLSKVKVFVDLYRQNKQLQEEIYKRNKLEKLIKLDQNFPEIIGNSTVMKDLFKSISQVASTNASVLIEGESGTGKELIAKAIHQNSDRSNTPYVKFCCASVSESLIETELFGYEKGSFTGADTDKIGRFELADTGTIFIDEIGELSLPLQMKLLRVLQDKEFERVGGVDTKQVDVRVIAATNRPLLKLVKQGKFREDLYYRLNNFPLYIPPLRERHGDISQLATYFLKMYRADYQKKVDTISTDALALLESYNWPGNVRELQNIISRAVIITPTSIITKNELNDLSKESPTSVPAALSEFASPNTTNILPEKELLKKYAKEVYENQNRNKSRTCAVLGIDIKTLNKRLGLL